MHRLVVRLAILALLGSAMMAAAGPASDQAYFWPPALDVSIFKNNCAYIIREGEVEVAPEGVLTEKIPRPVLGTLDVYSLTEGARVTEVVAFYDEVEKVARITDVETFYRRQIGRRITLEYGGGKVEGTLRAVLAPGHLLVEAAGGSALIPLGEVTRLTLAGDAPLEMAGEGRQPRFRIRLTGPARRARLGLSYLEESWAWFPSYRVNLRPKEEAELVLTATVVNNAEDVNGAVLHLIVGVPNFLMRGTLSPMVLDVETGLLERRVMPAAPSQVFDNALRMEKSYAAGGESPVTAVGSVEDLFVYEKKGFSLGEGQRMQLELFRGTVPCTPVYKWEIPLPDAERYYGQRYLQQQGKFTGEQTGQVWHYLRLTNNTAVPWTTGPAMIVSGWQPIAQDQLKYVAIGGQYDLRVTVAPEIRGEAREEEVGRKTVRLFGNDDYLLITVRGTMTLENLKKGEVRLEAAKDLWGEVKDTGGGKQTRQAEYLWNINPHSKLEWQFTLPPGGKKTITYTYELYVNI